MKMTTMIRRTANNGTTTTTTTTAAAAAETTSLNKWRTTGKKMKKMKTMASSCCNSRTSADCKMDADQNDPLDLLQKWRRRRKSSSSTSSSPVFFYRCLPSPPAICLLLLLFFGQSASARLQQHWRRDTTSTAPQMPPNNNIVFRYQCPQGCLCVPDIVDIELLIVSCRWPSLPPGAFEQFPRNGTKSLTIHCSEEVAKTAAAASCLGKAADEECHQESALALPGTFVGFTELRELKIQGCQSGHLSADLFPPRLRALWLGQMPALRSLEADFFVQLALVEKLTLAGTGLTQMPVDGLCQLQQLQVLNLSGNALDSARLGILVPRPQDQPCQLDQLLMLDLSANGIRVLAEQDLRPFPALRQLSLRSNGLVEMETDVFRSAPVPLLQHLDLAGNRLSQLPAHGLPEGLLHLELADNLFERVPEPVAQLAGLIRLNLSGNSITDAGLEGTTLQSSGLEQLDLAWNRLSQLPLPLFADSADSLRTLGLAGNVIEQLEAGQMHNLSSLHELDLSSNRLARLQPGALDGLAELAILQLPNNSIVQVDPEVFKELGASLHTLNMAQNQLTELPVAISRLSRAKRIDLSQNRISKAYKFVLNKLPHLTRLDLSQNALESVDSYVFKDCDHLQELNLRANRIQAISPDAFEKCPRLKRIDLADNQLTSLGPALTQLRALRSVNLTGNALEELNWAQLPGELLELLANGNRIRRIGTILEQSSEVVEESGGDGRKLRRLELKGNRLARLSADQLPLSLEELDLSGNQLAHVANSSFHGLFQLKTVNLRANKLRTIPRQLFDLTVGANSPFGRLWIGENPLECNCEMGWLLNASRGGEGGGGGVPDIGEVECVVPLNGHKKPVAETTSADFLCQYGQICDAGCLCCQFHECDCKSRCPRGCQCFRDWHSVTNVVKCSVESGGKGEEQQQQPKSGEEAEEFFRELPMPASHILLSGLNIPVLKSSAFFGRDRLLELHINASGIHTIQPSAFNTLKNLRSLHLANNHLARINGDEGFRTLNIRQLNLANNRLGAVDANLSAMAPNLELLLLEGNALEELPQYVKNASASAQLRQLSLAGNPFRCDCSSAGRFDTAHWLLSNQRRVPDADRVNCVENVTRAMKDNDTTVLSTNFPNMEDDDLFAMPMLEFLREENRTLCVARPSGVFGIGGPFDAFLFFFAMVALLILLPMVALLTIRPGWFERLLLSADRPKLAGSPRMQQEPLLKENNSSSLSSTHSPTTNGNSPLPPIYLPNECDMFVCYAKKDEPMVREFKRQLEDFTYRYNYNYNLCLLHECHCYRSDRAYISDDLDQLIKNSQVLVIFLSHEFLEQEWKMPQLSTCLKTQMDKKQMEKDRRRERRILIIMDDKMDQDDKNQLPRELGENMRLHPGCLTLSKNNPRFYDEVLSVLHPLRFPSPVVSETSQSHIYSEYGLPPEPSEFV